MASYYGHSCHHTTAAMSERKGHSCVWFNYWRFKRPVKTLWLVEQRLYTFFRVSSPIELSGKRCQPRSSALQSYKYEGEMVPPKHYNAVESCKEILGRQKLYRHTTERFLLPKVARCLIRGRCLIDIVECWRNRITQPLRGADEKWSWTRSSKRLLILRINPAWSSVWRDDKLIPEGKKVLGRMWIKGKTVD